MAEGFGYKVNSARGKSSQNQRRNVSYKEDNCTLGGNHIPEEMPLRNRNHVNHVRRSAPNNRAVCHFFKRGICQYGDRCRFSHCDNSRPSIYDIQSASTSSESNPSVKQDSKSTGPNITDKVQQENEKDQIARSREKKCSVCFETIMEKSNFEQKFGILPNCNHCFCLMCIRKWRKSRQFDHKLTRACPVCRVLSDFVCPSKYWFDTEQEKQKLIADYKNALGQKGCKYFNQGRGNCPFGNKCFYLHALPDGTKKDVGPPVHQHRRRNHEMDMDVLQHVLFWDMFDELNNLPYMHPDELEYFLDIFSDSDDSDSFDENYEFFF